MRTITIDFTASTVVGSYNLGKRGEHNATTLTFTPPTELSTESRTDNYRVAFNTGGTTILSSAYTSVPFSIALGSQLTQHSRMSLQVIAYDADGEYVGKSDKLSSFYFEGSVDGTAVEIDGDNADIAYEVEQNTEARHTHSNKDLLDTIAENSDGDVTIDGSVFYTASETDTAIASAVAAAEGDLVEIASSATTSKYTAAELNAMGATGKGFSYLGNPVTGYKYSGTFYISLLYMNDGDNDRNSFIRIYAVDSSKSITLYDTRYLPIGYESNGLVYLNASSVLATDGWTPSADNQVATKKYVDDNAGGTVTWDDVQNKPDTFAPSAHTHTLSEITDYEPYDDTGIKSRLDTIEGKESVWDGKQDAITESNKLAYSLLSGTPTIPEVVDEVTSTGTDAVSGKAVYDYVDSVITSALTASYGGES